MTSGDGPPEGRDALVDLAAARLGGFVLSANDEFFAPKEHLLRPEPPRFDPDAYGERGKVMDGWETRRRREPGHDWCLIRLGVPGVVRAAVVDTTHFRGNAPEWCSIEGCAVDGDPPPDAPDAGEGAAWMPLLPEAPLQADTINRFDVDAPWRVTHVRLRIHPDGGVARLRVLGEPLADLRVETGTLDLASVVAGGRAVACSDAFFSAPHNLIAPGDATHMGDGWETRRRRGSGEDWAVIALAAPGVVERVEIDTTHFKGNAPDRCVVEACATDRAEPGADAAWGVLVPSTPVRPHARHRFHIDVPDPATHLRLRIAPDGGVARLRAFGRITEDGRWHAGLRWLDTLPPAPAVTALMTCCGSTAWAHAMEQARPFGDVDRLMATADKVWWDLDTADRMEAFAAHPRIGDRSGNRWSREEQSGAGGASNEVLDALAAGNAAYEERFGHVFLICATGKSAEEMLAALEQRLGNDPGREAEIGAEEQRKITRLRLEKLLRP